VLLCFVLNCLNPIRANARSKVACGDAEGFTQAELMVTIVVMGVLAAIAAPSFIQWLRQKQVDAALSQVELALEETQAEAIKRHQTCYLQLARGSNPTLTGNCLVTGDRVLKDVTLNHSHTSDPWKISFNESGENRSIKNGPGTAVLSSIDGNVKPKCLVISVGIGLRRSGQYDESKGPDEDEKCVTP
jgi:prepilin-type N-terminal cleavage/methylation domain-containing protein